MTAVLATGAARAALPPALVRLTTRAALDFAINGTSAGGASALAAALAKGALQGMIPSKIKILSGLFLAVILAAVGALFVPLPVLGDDPPSGAGREEPPPLLVAESDSEFIAEKEAKAPRRCILLWMNGGPSQIDTFDPKPNDPNGALFPAIDTTIKGVQISKSLPRLAKQTNHLAIIRSMTHREGDHQRSTHLMRTGYSIDGPADCPSLPCVLAKELSDAQPDRPRYLRLTSRGNFGTAGYGPGLLGAAYGPVIVEGLQLPAADAFEATAKGKGEALQKAVAKAFDLTDEKAAVRDAYGRGSFGQGCLLARRLIESGVPVVEVVMPGWDTHANAQAAVQKLSDELDAGFAELLKDLQERKLLETTLVIWMGEFGRTPRINNSGGRDHWPFGFTAVLAGCGIKGGQAIGKTSADATRIDEKPVSPAELLATIYEALGINPAKENRTATGGQLPLVEKGTKAVKEALR